MPEKEETYKKPSHRGTAGKAYDLRMAAPPGPCKVYRAVLNPDGKLIPGPLLRVEK